MTMPLKPPFDVPLTEAEIAKTEAFLLSKIAQSIRELPTRGDPGKLAAFMEDLRALSLVTPVKAEAPPAPEPTYSAKQLAAADDALLQKQNSITVKKESAEAVLTEVRGIPDEVVEKMSDAEVVEEIRAPGSTSKKKGAR